MIVTFNIPGKCEPKGSVSGFPIMRKNGKMGVVITHPKKVKAWQKIVSDAVAHHEPLSGPLGINLTFYLERPKTVTREYPEVKPDLDKLERAILDGLKPLIGNDSKVISLSSTKIYAHDSFVPGVIGAVWEITDQNKVYKLGQKEYNKWVDKHG